MTWRALFLMSCCTAALVRAEEPDPAELDRLQAVLETDVVTGASRAQERSDDAPATITVVTADDFRRYGLRTLGDAINFLSVGLVAQDPLHAIEVGSRGVLINADYGNHVLLIIDGHTVNEQWNGTAYYEQGLGVPLEFIDRVELIVGPGSVLYGSSAMLAVINVVTKRPRDTGGVAVVAEGSLAPPQDVNGAPRLPDAANWLGGTGRVSLLAGHETTLAGARFEVSLGAEYYAHRGQSLTFGLQSGLPNQWGPRSPEGAWGGTTTDSWWTQVPSGMLKVRWGDFTLWVRGSIYSRGTPAYDTFGTAADFDGPSYERDRFLNVELGWSRTLSARFHLRARAYADLYEYVSSTSTSSFDFYGSGELREGLDPQNLTFRHELRGGASWAGVELQGTLDWLGDGRFPLMFGVDGRLRHFEEQAEGVLDDGEVLYVANAYRADEWQVGVYAQQRARLLPSLQLNVGARVDLQAIFPARLSPRAALVWTLPWEGRLKAVFNSAYRAPSGYERYSEFSNQQSNPDLRPETVYTGEFSYEQRFGRHRALLGAFVSSYEQMIQYVPVEGDEGVLSYQNSGSLLNAGGNALLEGTFGRFGYGLSLTAAGTVIDEPLVASPGWFGNARVSYDFGEERPRVSLVGAFSGERLVTAAYNAGPAGETWDPSKRVLGPQAELRAAVDAPLPFLKGLWVRGVVGGQLMPFSAYTVGPRQFAEGDFVTPAQAPNSRLFVMLTLGWSLDPK
jgi:outer membrane receptor protein involved in Fe transport